MGQIIDENSTAYYSFLTVLDQIFASLIVAPLVVNYWRSTWNLMSYILYPDNSFYSALCSLSIGLIGNFVLVICQTKLQCIFHPDKNRLTFLIFSRIYTIVFGIICVNGWRGAWMLLELYAVSQLTPVCIVTIISLLCLACAKGLRNTLAAPFVVITDHSKDYFKVRTAFKSSVR